MRRLNGADALMLYLDRRQPTTTPSRSALDPSTDPTAGRRRRGQMFEERAHLLPVFRLRYLPTPLGLHWSAHETKVTQTPGHGRR